MARISKYAIDSNITGIDKLIGTDADDNDITKNFEISDLTTYIASQVAIGTVNTIPVFTAANKLGDSIMFKRSDANDLIVGNFPDGQYTTIGEGYVSVTGGIGCSNITAINGGIVVFNGSVQIGNETTDVLTINSETSFTALPSFADDAAASSLAQGRLYQTDGTGAAPLNIAGIVMVKQ